MSTSTRILAAFVIGATAGGLLGALLHSSGDVKSLTKENNKNQPSFLDRLFGTKHYSAKHTPAPQDPGEYEEA